MRTGGTGLAMLSIGDRYAARRNGAGDAIDRRPLCCHDRCSWNQQLSPAYAGRRSQVAADCACIADSRCVS